MKQYLICHYGGYLAFDAQHQKLCSTAYFNDRYLALVYVDSLIKVEINQQLHPINLTDSSLVILNCGAFIKIKSQQQFLIQQKSKEIYFSEQEVLAENQFYLSNQYHNQENNWAFEQNIYEINRYKKENTNTIPNKIWLYWEQVDKPYFIQQCEARIRAFHADKEIYFLNKKTISEFINQEFIQAISQSHISPTLRSDLIRLKLLYEHGGIWLDCSILINDHIDNILFKNGHFYDVYGFYSQLNSKFYYPDAIYPIIENWLLASPIKSAFIKQWLDELFLVTEIGVENLLKQISEREDYFQIKRNFNPYYYMAYITQQIALIKMKGDVSLKAYCAEHSAFYFQMRSHTLYGYTHFSSLNELVIHCAEQINYLPKIIKLTHVDRKNLEKIKALGYCTPNAYLYPFIY